MDPRPERGGVEEDKASQKANSPCKDYVSSYGIKRDQGLELCCQEGDCDGQADAHGRAE